MLDSTVQTIVAGVVVLALTAAVAVLAWHGTINGQAAIGFFSGLTLGGVAGIAHNAGVRSGAASATEGATLRRRP